MSLDFVPVRRALLSVSDKTGIVEFARSLAKLGIELLSTGGTHRILREAGLEVVDVSDVTGFPEMMDGRVKTLHPKIHGGLLAIRENPEHEAAMLAHGIRPIDLLVVNLYPFETTLAAHGSFDQCVENIDIGGPAMIRAAAKNHGDVLVVVDADDYGQVLAQLTSSNGETSLGLRKALAQKAYARTAAYDAAISNWLADQIGEATPAYRTIGGKLLQTMRYGENPHQSAAFYATPEQRPGVASARQMQGKHLSFNNINDTDAAFECVAEFDARERAAVAIVKHANPCGVALGNTLLEAYVRALACDPTSAFGGIVALNQRLDLLTAQEMAKIFTEVIIAPDADAAAIDFLASKKNLRLLLTGGMPDPAAVGFNIRSVAGGLLVQSRDNQVLDPLGVKIVTRRHPTEREMTDLMFAFRVAKHVKSNAIVYVRDLATVGIGAGQMSRIDSSRIAAWKAAEAARLAGAANSQAIGSVVASDAFFPFADGLLAAAEAGATAAIQPGGSVRDDEVIEAANQAGLAMVFTGMRHFKH